MAAIAVNKKKVTTSYTTRHLEVKLLDELRIVATLMRPMWTLEFAFNEVIRAGLPVLQKRLSEIEDNGNGEVQYGEEDE